jgi:hypothetical protein
MTGRDAGQDAESMLGALEVLEYFAADDQFRRVLRTECINIPLDEGHVGAMILSRRPFDHRGGKVRSRHLSRPGIGNELGEPALSAADLVDIPGARLASEVQDVSKKLSNEVAR